jgi:CHAD domain-containing protein
MTNLPADNDKYPVSRLLARLENFNPEQEHRDPEDIHRIRVAIKKSHAWLKLCHIVTGKTEQYKRVVAHLHELSKALAGQRDRDVALQTLAKLGRKYPGHKTQHLLELLSKELMQQPPPKLEALALHETIAQIRHALLPFTELQTPADKQLEAINRRYVKVCQHGAVALNSETSHDLHAWRKQVKTLGYQLAIAGMPKSNLKKLTRLGKKLGEVHDLCILQVMLDESRHDRALAPLYKRIAKERKALLKVCRKHHRHICLPRPHLPDVD